MHVKNQLLFLYYSYTDIIVSRQCVSWRHSGVHYVTDTGLQVWSSTRLSVDEHVN